MNGILALSVRPGNKVRIGNGYVTNLGSSTVRLAFQFDKSIPIVRPEAKKKTKAA